MVNSFRVVDLGYNKCMVVWTSEYDAFIDNPNLNEEQMHGFINNVINEIIDNVAMTAAK